MWYWFLLVQFLTSLISKSFYLQLDLHLQLHDTHSFVQIYTFFKIWNNYTSSESRDIQLACTCQIVLIWEHMFNIYNYIICCIVRFSFFCCIICLIYLVVNWKNRSQFCPFRLLFVPPCTGAHPRFLAKILWTNLWNPAYLLILSFWIT